MNAKKTTKETQIKCLFSDILFINENSLNLQVICLSVFCMFVTGFDKKKFKWSLKEG